MTGHKMKKITTIIIVILVGVMCSLYFYNQLIHVEIPIHSDDAGTATDIRDIIEMGCWRWTYVVSPFGWLIAGLYLLFGATEFFIQSVFTVKFFLCITLSFYLAIWNKEKMEWWIAPLFIFYSMPGCFGTASIQPLKFHVWTILIPLICLAYILCRGNDLHNLKRKDIFVLAIISALGIVEKDILIIVNCWIPFVLYWIIYFVQSGVVKKYIRQILLLGATGLILGRMVLGSYIYGGYGTSSFVSISELCENVQVGISGLLSMFNINLAGNIVLQYSTIMSLFRLALLVLAIIATGSRIKEIYKKKIENVSIIDAVLAISAIVVGTVYLIGGKREDDISIRYAAYLYYVLLILLCRKLCEVIHRKEFEIQIKKFSFNMISIFCFVCIIVSADPITMTRAENGTDVLAKTIESIDALQCGLGTFWQAGVISCLTDYQNEIQSVEWNGSEIQSFLTEWDSYRDGEKQYNFFVVNRNSNFGITEENLVDSYGEYQKKYTVDDNDIYLYNYDVRTEPLKIGADSYGYLNLGNNVDVLDDYICITSGENIKLNNLYITTGKVRLRIRGKFAKGALQIFDNQGVEIQLVSESRNECIYELTAKQLYEVLSIGITNISEKRVLIKDIQLERIDNCMALETNTEYTLELSPGYYIFGVKGDEIKNTKISFEVNGTTLDAERLNNGREKVAYGFNVTEKEIVNVKLFTQGRLDKVYYQNEISDYMVNPDKTIYTTEYKIRTNQKLGILYGPYIQMDTGKYLLDIYGENLERGNIHFTYDGGLPYNKVLLLDHTSEHYSYEIIIDESINNFEVIVSGINDEERTVKVDYYTLSKEDENMSASTHLTYYCTDSQIYTSEEKNIVDGMLTLDATDICFGPYIYIPAGMYSLTVYGENLKDINIRVTGENGTETINNLSKIKEDDGQISVSFKCETNIENFEVVITNGGNESIMLQRYELNRMNE